MFQNRFDQFYLTICQQVGGIENLLKSFFDFMARKTDFFYQCDPGDKMGFPPGYSRQLLLGIFEAFQNEHYKKFPKKNPQDFARKVEAFKSKEAIKNSQEKNLKKQQQESSITIKKTQQSKEYNQKTEKQQIKQQKIKQPLINTYNGGKTDRYSWSQQQKDIEVSIEVPSDTTAKMLNVQIKAKWLSIRKKSGELIIQGEFTQAIVECESLWKVEETGGKKFITVNLEKAQEKIWSTIFVGDPEIDTTKVNNTKKLDEFDGETQGAIRKIMYEQQRKQMGLPTSEEQNQIDALRKAWDSENSPFKGQPFDPSKFNLPAQP